MKCGDCATRDLPRMCGEQCYGETDGQHHTLIDVLSCWLDGMLQLRWCDFVKFWEGEWGLDVVRKEHSVIGRSPWLTKWEKWDRGRVKRVDDDRSLLRKQRVLSACQQQTAFRIHFVVDTHFSIERDDEQWKKLSDLDVWRTSVTAFDQRRHSRWSMKRW